MKSKTAVILTFSKDDNRGANLQCFALKKKLEEIGVDVKFLDIQLPRKKLNLTGRFVAFVKNICASSFRRHANFKYTKKYDNAEQLRKDPPVADIFIVGSDQVWNPDLTKKLDPRVYFFSFLSDSVKRISYAASFGTSNWSPTQYDADISNLLSKFHSISVREDSGVDICKSTFSIDNVEVCVDPSLLLNTQDIKNMTKGSVKPRKHLYSYLLYKSSAVFDLIDTISAQTNLKITGECRNGDIFNKLSNIHGVERWIKNIAEAELVVTNSFHTMVVSILLHKNFVIVPPVAGRETRLISLLGKLGLGERYIDYNNEIDVVSLPAIDYKLVEARLNKLRQDSINFLIKAVQE